MRFCEEEPTVFRNLLQSDLCKFIYYLEDFIGLFVAEISLRFVVERDIAKNPLGMRDVRNPENKLLVPILAI